MDSITKKCSICGEIKQISEFYVRRKRKYINASCKTCDYARIKRNVNKNINKIRDYGKAWRKAHADMVKEYNKKWYELNGKKECEKKRARRAENPEHERLLDRIRHIINPEKKRELSRNRDARKRGGNGKITKDQWIFVKEKYGNICLCCGRGDLPLTMDHVIPLKLGGLHVIENIQPLCLSCNSSKGAKFIDYRGV